MKLLLQLFWIFFKTGTFTIGGGLAMLPLLEKELVDKTTLISKENFADIIAICQSIPGILAINMAVFIGHKIGKLQGSIICVFATVLIPFIICVIVSLSFIYFKDNVIVKTVFMGIRPAIVAIICVSLINLIKTVNINYTNVWIPLLVIGLIYFFHISPAWIIILALIVGIVKPFFKLKL